MNETIKKGKFVTKIFFHIMLNEVLKMYENTEMTSVDVKANKNNKK